MSVCPCVRVCVYVCMYVCMYRRRYDIQQARWHSVSASSGTSAKTGGIQASFDVTQAFDRLGWTLVQEALIDAQVPVELRGQLLDFYRHLGYHLRFGDEHAVVRASRGVKQGCKLAPLLWSLTTGLLMRRLARRTSQAWLLRVLTALADDLHLGQEVCLPWRSSASAISLRF